jgi:hypothetical protein
MACLSLTNRLKITIFITFSFLKLKIYFHSIFMDHQIRIVLFVQYCSFIYKCLFDTKVFMLRTIPRIQTFHDFEVNFLLSIVFEHTHSKLLVRCAMNIIVDELTTKNVVNFTLSRIAKILLDLCFDLINRKLSHRYRLVLLVLHHLFGLKKRSNSTIHIFS